MLFQLIKFPLSHPLLAILAIVALVPDTNFFGFDFLILPKEANTFPDSFSGALIANSHLSKADQLYRNEILGPESFAAWKGNIYTSLGDGRIVQVLDDRLETVAFLDPNNVGLKQCSKPWVSASHCSRPLGIKFHSDGTLYTVDPYHGLFAVNVTTGDVRQLLDITKQRLADGSKIRFLDDLEIVTKTNSQLIFYFSDASTRWDLHDVSLTVAEHDKTGRLVRFDVESGQLEIELNELAFPNGLQLTDDRTAILVCLFNHRRIAKYYISGPNKGKLVTWVDNLPGEPDNIKRSQEPEETYWVGLYTARNRHLPHLTMDILANHGFGKRFLFRFLRLMGYCIQTVGEHLHLDVLQQIGFELKTIKLISRYTCQYGMAVEIDVHGTIVNSIHSPDGHICNLSEMFEAKQTENERHFYIGSYYNEYIGKLVLPKSVFRSSYKPQQLQQITKVPNLNSQSNSSISNTNSAESNVIKEANIDHNTGNRHQEL